VAAERLGIGRACPRCGARSDTLGSICPACGKPYVLGGLLERLPFMGDDVLTHQYAPQILLLLGAGLVVGWIWLLLTHLVAAIIVAGAAFGLLVAAIGVTNVLSERGR
jgi:hypothetical protein